MGSIGIMLIVYGVVSLVTSSMWAPLEKIAEWIATITTLIAVFFTVVSIYFPINVRKPDPLSLYFTAPIVIIAVFVAVVYTLYSRTVLPVHLVSGFAILGLSGALFRILSR